MSKSERGGEAMRGLTGAGASRVSLDKAMRARDVSRERAASRPGEPEGEPADDPGRQDEGGSGSAGSSPVDS